MIIVNNNVITIKLSNRNMFNFLFKYRYRNMYFVFQYIYIYIYYIDIIITSILTIRGCDIELIDPLGVLDFDDQGGIRI